MGECGHPGEKKRWQLEILHRSEKSQGQDSLGCLWLPSTDEILDCPSGVRWFSSLDLNHVT